MAGNYQDKLNFSCWLVSQLSSESKTENSTHWIFFRENFKKNKFNKNSLRWKRKETWKKDEEVARNIYTLILTGKLLEVTCKQFYRYFKVNIYSEFSYHFPHWSPVKQSSKTLLWCWVFSQQSWNNYEIFRPSSYESQVRVRFKWLDWKILDKLNT